MEVRTYRGKGLKQLISKVKRDLGREALILSTTELDGEVFEIKAAPGSSNQARSPEMLLERPAELLLEEAPASVPQPAELPDEPSSALCEQGISSDLALSILSACGGAALNGEDLVTEGLSQSFGFDSSLVGKPRVLAFVGTTGVGKTTTIAKLAARMRLSFDMRIGLISADRFRVGAGYHLQAYAQMLNVRCVSLSGSRIKDDAEALRQALHEFRNFDLVMIDTAGCSPREMNRLSKLEESLAGIEDVEKVLCLPAPSNDCDLRLTRRAFERLEPSRVVLTKLDETGFLGPVLNIAYTIGLPLAFFTTGQRVPEDIEPASARRLAWMLTRTMH